MIAEGFCQSLIHVAALLSTLPEAFWLAEVGLAEDSSEVREFIVSQAIPMDKQALCAEDIITQDLQK